MDTPNTTDKSYHTLGHASGPTSHEPVATTPTREVPMPEGIETREVGGGRAISSYAVTAIAKVCHEANRLYCNVLGDYSQRTWESAPQWQRDSTEAGVRAIMRGDVRTPGDLHRSWLREKERTGWVYGAVKDEQAKTHPCMVPFDWLPVEQQAKDCIFFAIASTMLESL